MRGEERGNEGKTAEEIEWYTHVHVRHLNKYVGIIDN